MPTLKTTLAQLKALANPKRLAESKRVGINTQTTYGITVPQLRQLAKEIGRNHALALELWDSGIHEARLLASMMADPKQVTEALMESWAKDFDSWDIVDGTCFMFDRTPFAYAKAKEWSARPEEFVKRAGFVLMAALAVHDKAAPDSKFTPFLSIIKREAKDERNFVKKAVNWALRQIGKRNVALNAKAIATAHAIAKLNSSTARWVAADALRELQSEAKQTHLKKKADDGR